jgi:predicted transcriptional regulator
MAVMQHVWACLHAGCLALDVQQTLERVRPLALTTILTTLDRLCKKGILRRERVGKAYRYWAAVSEEQLQQRIVEGVLSNLIAQFPKAVAAYFAHRVDPHTPGSGDEEKLAALAQRVEAMKSISSEGNGPNSAEETPDQERA